MVEGLVNVSVEQFQQCPDSLFFHEICAYMWYFGAKHRTHGTQVGRKEENR